MRARFSHLMRRPWIALSILPWIPVGIAQGQPDHGRFNPFGDDPRPEQTLTTPPLQGVPHGASVAGPATNPMAPIAPPSTYAPPAGALQQGEYGGGYDQNRFLEPRRYYYSPYHDPGAYGPFVAPAPYMGYGAPGFGPGFAPDPEPQPVPPTSSYSQDPRARIQIKLRKLLQSRAHEAGIQDCPMPRYPDLRYTTPSPLTCR